MQYRIQHKIKQDLLREGLKQPRASPMRARLTTSNMAQELDCIPEDIASPPDSSYQDDTDLPASIADDITAVLLENDYINTQEINSAQYDYP
jgi:hypothetical protein